MPPPSTTHTTPHTTRRLWDNNAANPQQRMGEQQFENLINTLELKTGSAHSLTHE